MHSISNLMKLNDFNSKKVEFESMSLSELQQYFRKFENLKNNKKLVDSLPDKGEKINNTLKKIKELIEKQKENVNNCDTKQNCASQNEIKEEKSKPEIKTEAKMETDVNSLLDKLENLDVKLNSESATKANSEKEINNNKKSQDDKPISLLKQPPKPKNANYFAKAHEKTSTKLNTDDRLNAIKEKILKKKEAQVKFKETKCIPVDECFKLLKDHEKKIQDLQMQQAAEKLLQGQSVVYDFSFLNKNDKEALKYRETKSKKEEDYYLNDDDDDESDEEEDNENYDYGFGNGDDDYSNQIDKLHKIEKDKNKYKNFQDLDTVD